MKINCVVIEKNENERIKLSRILKPFFNNLIVISRINSLNIENNLRSVNSNLIFINTYFDNINLSKLISNLSLKNKNIIFLLEAKDYSNELVIKSEFNYVFKPIEKESVFKVIKNITPHKNYNEGFKELIACVSEIETKNEIRILRKGSAETVNARDIIYFQADSNYTFIHRTQHPPTLVSKTLKKFTDQLELNKDFVKINQSYFININYVEKVLKFSHFVVLMKNQDILKITNSQKNQFFAKISR